MKNIELKTASTYEMSSESFEELKLKGYVLIAERPPQLAVPAGEVLALTLMEHPASHFLGTDSVQEIEVSRFAIGSDLMKRLNAGESLKSLLE